MYAYDQTRMLAHMCEQQMLVLVDGSKQLPVWRCASSFQESINDTRCATNVPKLFALEKLLGPNTRKDSWAKVPSTLACHMRSLFPKA